MLGRELAAGPQRRGDFHPCCCSPCCSRQLPPLSQLGPLLPISHAQRVALRWGGTDPAAGGEREAGEAACSRMRSCWSRGEPRHWFLICFGSWPLSLE